MSETTELRWFEAFPKCAQCGKTSQGILRGSRNESYGHHCQRCATKRLKDSGKARKAKLVALEMDALLSPKAAQRTAP